MDALGLWQLTLEMPHFEITICASAFGVMHGVWDGEGRSVPLPLGVCVIVSGFGMERTGLQCSVRMMEMQESD